MTIIYPIYIHTAESLLYFLYGGRICSPHWRVLHFPPIQARQVMNSYTARTESSRRRYFHDTTGFRFFLCNILQRLFSTAVERILIVSSFIFPRVSHVSRLHLLFEQSLACKRGVHMLTPVYIKN
jgi:hypothetical protein